MTAPTDLCNARFLSRSSWPGGNINSVFESPLLWPFLKAVGGICDMFLFGNLWLSSSSLYMWGLDVVDVDALGNNSDPVRTVSPIVFKGLLKVIWPCEKTLRWVAGKADDFLRAEGSAWVGWVSCASFSSSVDFVGCLFWASFDITSQFLLVLSLSLTVLCPLLKNGKIEDKMQ